MWINIHRSNKWSHIYQVDVVWQNLVFPKYIKITNLQYLKNKSRYEIDFFMWKDIHRKGKLIHKYQMCLDTYIQMNLVGSAEVPLWGFLNQLISQLPFNTVRIGYQQSTLCHCGIPQFNFCHCEATLSLYATYCHCHMHLTCSKTICYSNISNKLQFPIKTITRPDAHINTYHMSYIYIQAYMHMY